MLAVAASKNTPSIEVSNAELYGIAQKIKNSIYAGNKTDIQEWKEILSPEQFKHILKIKFATKVNGESIKLTLKEIAEASYNDNLNNPRSSHTIALGEICELFLGLGYIQEQ